MTQQRAEITLAFAERLSLSTSNHFFHRRRGKGLVRLSCVRGPGTILEEIGNEAVQGRGRFPDALPRLRDMQDARLTGLLIGHRRKRVVEPAHHHSQRLPFVDAIVVVRHHPAILRGLVLAV